MFIQLLSIEWTRLNRRTILWLSLVVSAFFITFAQQNFYTRNQIELLSGDLAMPGFSFDLATSIDQIMLIALPFLVIMASLALGNDYKQHTNQHWLMRASRSSSIMAKFMVLTFIVLIFQLLSLIVGGGVGWFFKTFTYEVFSAENVNWIATLAAPFYMTLVSLPYIAFMLLITVITRSAFASVVVGLGLTQFVEILLTAAFYDNSLASLMPRNLYFSATYLLNSIGNVASEVRPGLLEPNLAFVAAAVYTILCLTTAVWLYRRQDLGG